MSSRNILIIEDEVSFCNRLAMVLRKSGHFVETAYSGINGVEKATKIEFDLVLLDYILPDIDGAEVLRRIKKISQATQVVIMTAHGTLERAVECMKLGAFDFFTKTADFEDIKAKVFKSLDFAGMREELSYLRSRLASEEGAVPIVGNHETISQVIDMADTVASSRDTSVLLCGESGSGKGVVARYIHNNSARKNHPFMVVDCSSLPETLLDSELFGHERGAFTGAVARKRGQLEVADRGTVFLDEIGDLGPNLQGKLLRFLEEKTIKRIGGNLEIKLDVRIIAATNKNLLEMIKDQSAFRSDLFYRLQVFRIDIPPLRKRGRDIVLMANRFIERFNQKLNRTVKPLDPEIEALFLEYSFPGNVRELLNIIERAVLLATEDRIEKQLLPAEMQQTRPEFVSNGRQSTDSLSLTIPLGETSLEKIEEKIIKHVLRHCEDNQTRTAKMLGISRYTLYRKLKKYGAAPP